MALSAIHTTRIYPQLPEGFSNILLDQVHEHFSGKKYNLSMVRTFCKDYIRSEGYSFDNIDVVIKKVIDTLHQEKIVNVTQVDIVAIQKRYAELIQKLMLPDDELPPQNIHDAVDILEMKLAEQQALVEEHYANHIDAIQPGESQE